MVDLDALVPTLQQVLAKAPEVAAGYLFGPVARGCPQDDIGIVYRKRDDSPHERVSSRLAGGLSRWTGFGRVDVIDLAPQGSVFAHRVLCDGRLVAAPQR